MNKKKTLAERHALKRLEKVEENQRKAYEKKQNDFPWKQIVMGLLFGDRKSTRLNSSHQD